MEIKSIEDQKGVFINYTNKYISSANSNTINGYKDKQSHSLFVLEEAMLTDDSFTHYTESYRNLLAIQSLFHDIGRFEQLKVTGTFNDSDIKKAYELFKDHGDLGAELMETEGLLDLLIPSTRIYDEEVKKVIKAHSKRNPQLLDLILKEYIHLFKNYDLRELFLSKNTYKEREVLSATNTAIIQDVDRLDIFRKIVRGIWIPSTTRDSIDPELFELFKNGNLPSISEIKRMGKWNANVGHLIRMDFINQMNLVPVLIKIRDEQLIDKIYNVNGNDIVLPAYEEAKKLLKRRINESNDGIIVNKKR